MSCEYNTPVAFSSPAEREAVIKWIEELESGKYEQVAGFMTALVTGKDGIMGYCCLGVLEKFVHNKNPEYLSSLPEEGTAMLHPTLQEQSLQDWLVPMWAVHNVDLSGQRRGPEIQRNLEHYKNNIISLTELNDRHGFTFPMIAQVLRNVYRLQKENANV